MRSRNSPANTIGISAGTYGPGDDAVVKLLWLAIINIEDKRARERARRREETGKRHDQPARLIEGQRVMGWREALNELDTAYPGRIK
jgi:putative transposase